MSTINETTSAATAELPLLEATNIAKSYGPVTALRDAGISLAAGEVIALVGDNGAGKSTLIKILSGIVAPDSGVIKIAGKPVSLHDPKDATALGISTVYQDLALCGNLDVTENIFLGSEKSSKWWKGALLSRPLMERETRDVLKALGTRIPRLDSTVSVLSGGQRQCIAVCKAILGDPRVVILDEPTAALGVAQTREVLELIGRMRDQGRGVILVSHDLADVLTIADRIVVMRLGETVADRPVDDWSEHTLVSAITGASMLGDR